MMESQTTWFKQPARRIQILHEVFSTLWVHEIQPAAWQMSLMQPIYKGGDKAKADPASYRDMYIQVAHWLNCLRESLFLD